MVPASCYVSTPASRWQHNPTIILLLVVFWRGRGSNSVLARPCNAIFMLVKITLVRNCSYHFSNEPRPRFTGGVTRLSDMLCCRS